MTTGSTLRSRRLHVLLAVSLLPLWLSFLVLGVGRIGPTLIWDGDGEYFRWYGLGKLPRVTWASMQQPGAELEGEADDFLYRFWGGCTAEDGTIMVATGPEGIAIARCRAPYSRYGGYLCADRLIHPGALLLDSAGASLGFGIALFTLFHAASAAWRKLKGRPGYCRKCGYNLYGLPENRCPECGTPFELADPQRQMSHEADKCDFYLGERT